jgi:hypothetical protein
MVGWEEEVPVSTIIKRTKQSQELSWVITIFMKFNVVVVVVIEEENKMQWNMSNDNYNNNNYYYYIIIIFTHIKKCLRYCCWCRN